MITSGLIAGVFCIRAESMDTQRDGPFKGIEVCSCRTILFLRRNHSLSFVKSSLVAKPRSPITPTKWSYRDNTSNYKRLSGGGTAS